MTDTGYTEKPVPHNDKPATKSSKPLIITAIVAGVLGLALCGSLIALAAATMGDTTNRPSGQSGMMQMNGSGNMPNGESRGGRGGMGMNDGGAPGAADSDTRVNGVVTSVDGDTIIVSGNGKQVTVKKTSATTIRGTSETVAINDTVIMTGTTTDNVFTATTITIRNMTSN